MNPSIASVPPRRPERPPRPRQAAGDDLELSILDAERAVIERDERVQRHAALLVARGERFTERMRHHLGRFAAAGAALGIGSLLLARWLPRHATAAVARAPRRLLHSARSARHHDLPWGRLLALGWPLLPLGLRSRLSPKSAALLMSLGLPLLARGTRADAGEGVQPASAVDLRRYAGRWHEIARLPMRQERLCASGSVADYTLLSVGPDDSDIVLGVTNRCRTRDGRVAVAIGDARVVPGSRGARLKVCFAPQWLRWLPAVWADYWILHVDADYRSALVGTPDRRHLWLLARQPSLPGADLQQLVAQARAQGYDTDRLRLTPRA